MNGTIYKHDFWKNKTIISYFLAVLVVILHIDTFDYYPKDGTLISIINSVFYTAKHNVLNPIAVPLFFIISGATFFRDFNIYAYINKLKSRIRSLVIPYLFWNTVGVLCACILWQTHREMFFGGSFAQAAENWIEAILLRKCYGPFWFIFNIIVFVVISPLFEILLKSKVSAIAVLLLLLAGYQYGISLPTALFFRGDAIIYYFLGAYIGKYHFDWFSAPVDRRTSAFAAVGLAAYLCVFGMSAYQLFPLSSAAFCTLVSIGGISFWFVCSAYICPRIKYRALYKTSFAVYAMHFYLNYVISRAVYKLLPNPIWAIPNFFITLVTTLVVIRIFCVLCERYFPKIYNVIMGERAKA